MENDSQTKLNELRYRAKQLLREDPAGSKGRPADDVQLILRELRFHQIELEIQKDELRSIQDELEETRDRYSHLYDFAPIGYLTMNRKGVIHEANLTLAAMLGLD